MLAHVLVELGHLDEARDYAEACRDITDEGDVWSQMLWRSALSRTLARERRGAEAAELAREATESPSGRTTCGSRAMPTCTWLRFSSCWE
jgi:hypothetical protein